MLKKSNLPDNLCSPKDCTLLRTPSPGIIASSTPNNEKTPTKLMLRPGRQM